MLQFKINKVPSILITSPDSLLIARAHYQMFHHQFRNRHRGNQGKTKKNQEKENLNDQYHNISKIQHQKLN